MTFILLGKYLEASAKGRTSAAIQALLTLAPPTALLLEGGDADAPDVPAGKGADAAAPATEREVPTALIHRGDRLKVRQAFHHNMAGQQPAVELKSVSGRDLERCPWQALMYVWSGAVCRCGSDVHKQCPAVRTC